MHEHAEDKLAHYAKRAIDFEYLFPHGWNELEGVHNRTDYDLSRHQEASGKKMEYVDAPTNTRFVPYVIETAIGLNRLLLAVLADAYHEEEVEGESRTVLKLHPSLAPTSVAVFPLVKKDGMPEMAERITADLKRSFAAFYDESGSIGRRYRRQDEAGTPFCVTVDGQSMEDGTVTVRDRDTLEQDRVSADAPAGRARRAAGGSGRILSAAGRPGGRESDGPDGTRDPRSRRTLPGGAGGGDVRGPGGPEGLAGAPAAVCHPVGPALRRRRCRSSSGSWPRPPGTSAAASSGSSHGSPSITSARRTRSSTTSSPSGSRARPWRTRARRFPVRKLPGLIRETEDRPSPADRMPPCAPKC